MADKGESSLAKPVTRNGQKPKDKVPVADSNNIQIGSILENISSLSEKVAQTETFMKSMADLPALVQQQSEMLASITSQMNFCPDDEEMEEFTDSQNGTETEVTDTQAFQTLLNGKDNLMEKVDSNSATENQNELLEIFKARNQRPGNYAEPLNEAVAKLFVDLLETVTEKKLVDRLKEQYKTPQNCPNMCVPKVNPELWSALESGTSLATEHSLYNSEEPIVCAMIINARLVELLSKSSKDLPPEFCAGMMNLLSDGAAAITIAVRDMNQRRKNNMKPQLSSDIQAICSSRVKTSEFLFGDNLTDEIKRARTSAHMVKPRQNTRGRFQPYFRGNINGRGQFRNFRNGAGNLGQAFNQTGNLNFRQPPPLYFRGRGGRGNQRGHKFQNQRQTQ